MRYLRDYTMSVVLARATKEAVCVPFPAACAPRNPSGMVKDESYGVCIVQNRSTCIMECSILLVSASHYITVHHSTHCDCFDGL